MNQSSPTDRMPRSIERPLPYTLEAEMALLGAMLLNPAVVPDVTAIIRDESDFYALAHQAIWQSLIRVYEADPKADLVPILEDLRDHQALDLIGGQAYLEKLATETPSSAGANHYAKLVVDKARLRELVEASEQTLYDIRNIGNRTPQIIIDEAETRIFRIAEQRDSGSEASGLDLDAAFAEMQGETRPGILTGYTDFDRLTGGLQPGEMVILAARPSQGKSALMLNIAENLARFGHAVALFSLEMSRRELTHRLLSAASGVSSMAFRTGTPSRDAAQRVADAIAAFPRERLLVDDTPGLTVMQLRAKARRLAARHQVAAVFVDYLQLMTAPGNDRENRQVEVSAISRGVKALARELDLPVVALCQLNRKSTDREDNRPRMSDLRESGSLEQDADVVLLLHREEQHHPGDEDWRERNRDKIGVAELIIAKQRNGPTGSVTLTWDDTATRFKNHAQGAGGRAPREEQPTWGHPLPKSKPQPVPTAGLPPEQDDIPF